MDVRTFLYLVPNGQLVARYLSHGVAGIAAYSLIALTWGMEPASKYSFFAGMAAMLLDLEKHDVGRHHAGPLTHSILGGILMIGGFAAIGFFLNNEWALVGLAAVSSHLLLNSMEKDGIFLFPTGITGMHEVLPQGAERAFPAWSIIPPERIRKNGREAEDAVYNTVILVASVVIILYFIIGS